MPRAAAWWVPRLGATRGAGVWGKPKTWPCVITSGDFGVDEHAFVINFDVHQGYRGLTHSHLAMVNVPSHASQVGHM